MTAPVVFAYSGGHQGLEALRRRLTTTADTGLRAIAGGAS